MINIKEKFDIHFDPLAKTIHQSLAIAALSLTLIISSLSFSLFINQTVKNTKNRLSAEQADYDTIKNDKGILKDYYPLFIKMNKAGLISAENRLNWVEVLQKSARQLKIKTLKYNISQQVTLEEIASVSTEVQEEEEEFFEDEEGGETTNRVPFNIYASKMSLELGMLHEGDFLKLIDLMKTNSKSFFIIRSCELHRTEEQLDYKQFSQNIMANCELLWLSIQGNNKE
jgi:hypothetical protein